MGLGEFIPSLRLQNKSKPLRRGCFVFGPQGTSELRRLHPGNHGRNGLCRSLNPTDVRSVAHEIKGGRLRRANAKRRIGADWLPRWRSCNSTFNKEVDPNPTDAKVATRKISHDLRDLNSLRAGAMTGGPRLRRHGIQGARP